MFRANCKFYLIDLFEPLLKVLFVFLAIDISPNLDHKFEILLLIGIGIIIFMHGLLPNNLKQLFNISFCSFEDKFIIL